jgi:hypothetical protein
VAPLRIALEVVSSLQAATISAGLVEDHPRAVLQRVPLRLPDGTVEIRAGLLKEIGVSLNRVLRY